MTYQRFLTPESTPYDPLALAKKTEEIVTRKSDDEVARKYIDFYSAPVYGGIATGYAVGCCLRCMYCWTNWSRDFPEQYGELYSPTQACQELLDAAKRGVTRWKRYRDLPVNKLRLSGCEPTLGKQHLLSLLDRVKGTGYPFYLETNGILLGADRSYVEALAEFSAFLYVRVSFKAATPAGFQERTGAMGNCYELPFKALNSLLDAGIVARPAAMTDPKVMPEEERDTLIEKLGDIDPRIARNPDHLEEERIDPYGTTKKRLKAANDAEYAQKLRKKLR